MNFKKQTTLKLTTKSPKETCLNLKSNKLLYIITHLKLATLFYSTQLIDIFAYEFPRVAPINSNNRRNTALCYNFYNIKEHERLLIIILTGDVKNEIPSIVNFFQNANWLEREAGEMHGIYFCNKKDSRNLMLPYGDSSHPLQKNTPSIGTRELFYDVSEDLIYQTNVTLQF